MALWQEPGAAGQTVRISGPGRTGKEAQAGLDCTGIRVLQRY